MKLKCCPADFQVDEQSSFSLDRGEYAVYCLTKQSLGTVEAIEAICNRWKLPRERLSYGGLKDRHAITRQFVTILRGPHRDLQQSSFSLQYLGQSAQPFTPLDIEGNRFRIVLRDLLATEAERLSHEWQLTLQHGVPNYFDDQRFGSLGKSGEFVAAPWCQGKYDRALWLALAEENDHDRPDDQRNKQILRDFWDTGRNARRGCPPVQRRESSNISTSSPVDLKKPSPEFGLIFGDCTCRRFKAIYGTKFWLVV